MNTPASVLIVDDHPDNRTVFSHLLEHAGFAVRVACDGREAVDLARDRRPDLILMDLAMPHMDGIQATRILNNGNGEPPIPIIAVTARDTCRDELEPFGFCGLLQKPVRIHVLLAAVQTCLGGNGIWID